MRAKFLLGTGTFLVAASFYFLFSKTRIDSGQLEPSLLEKPAQSHGKSTRQDAKANKASTYQSPSRNKAEAITPEKALELINEFKSKNQDMSARTIFCSGIIRKLCENGYSSEAWDLIESGLGSVRLSQLSAFFSAAKLPTEDLLVKLKTIGNGGEMVSSFGYFLTKFKPRELSDFLDSQKFREFTDSPESLLSKEKISQSLSLVLQRNLNDATPHQVNDVTNTISTMHSKSFLNPDDLLIIASKPNVGGPFAAWNLIKSVDANYLTEGSSADSRTQLIAKMVSTDAPKSIATIFEIGGVNFSRDVDSAISDWVNIDSEGATAWYGQNQTKLTSQQRNAVASAFSKAAMDSLEFSGAQQWAFQIQDISLRDEILKAISDKREPQK